VSARAEGYGGGAPEAETPMKERRVCLDSGYKYEYDGPARGQWKSSSDERWDTVVHKVVCGKLVGHRRIDGAPVTVVRAGGKLYAATHATRGMPPSKSKAGTPFAGTRRRRRRRR
jgi:hypothetical protein